jgi:hypothetical protein
MSTDSVRRSILRQGFIVLLIGFATGFGVVAGGTTARAWLGTHLTIMLTAVFMILVGLVWNDLVLTDRQRRVLRFAIVLDGYWGIIAGVFATLLSIPGPVSGGGRQPSGWPATVFFTAFIPVLTILPFVFSTLVLYGLRGTERSRGE